MKIRLTGSPAELIRAIDLIGAQFEVTRISPPKRCRNSTAYRVYLDVRIPDSPPPERAQVMMSGPTEPSAQDADDPDDDPDDSEPPCWASAPGGGVRCDLPTDHDGPHHYGIWTDAP